MICPNCKQEIPDDSHFCQVCGSPVTPVVPEPEPVVAEPEVQPDAAQPEGPEFGAETAQPESPEFAAEAAQPENPYMQPGPGPQPYVQPEPQPYVQPDMPPTQEKKGLSKPVLFGIIGGGVFLVAAMITLLVVFLVAGSTEVINLQDYTIVSFDGINGDGTASAEIDEAELATRILEINGMNSQEYKDMSLDELLQRENLSDLMDIYQTIMSVQPSLDRVDGLSNGDTVTVTYSFNVEKALDVGAEFVGEPLKKTVSGLQEVQSVDPFENLHVYFEGTSPRAYINWEVDGADEWMNQIRLTVSQRDNLKLGDKVVLRIEGENQQFEERYGIRLSTLEKEYIVEGVDAYVTENEELDPGAVETMQQVTEGYITEYFGDASRRDVIEVSDVQYVGYYLLTNKSTDIWSGYNKVYMILSGKVSSKEKPKQFKPKEVFFPVEYDDIKILADGSYEIGTNYKRILGSTDLKFGYWEMVSGYTDMAEMEEELIGADTQYEGIYYEGES